MLEHSWRAEANALGYENEKEMLLDLYVVNGFSIGQISKMLGYSFFTVRRRLQTWGVQLRKRGGPNNSGCRKLKNLSDEKLTESPGALAKEYNVHVATVFAEKRLRARMKEMAV